MHPKAQYLSDELQENDYIQTNKDEKMDVRFSTDGNKVKIDLITGYKEYDDGNLIKYELREGTFAGGRFVVRLKGKIIEAELTIFGSGVPIIRSSRGYLIVKK